ncbi:MAG: translation initiation factor IF-2 [Candidatus Diapherotrites archaeon]|nr:translation initiation factor IF-2 [Candidatus Diapherotrites archaeon]
MIRQPIIVVMGHIDHGKTKLLDRIRGTTIAEREAGAITQHIGATELPENKIQAISGNLLKQFGFQLEIPGLLFIDTPGHDAFTNLRRRGGSIADLSILVVDCMQGIQPQTLEAIQILKTFKVPFVVAFNKIDKLQNWQSKTGSFLENEKIQTTHAQELLDKKIYELVGRLFELGFEAERFDRIQDFRKQIAIVPLSAVVGEGIPELLMMLSGLSQKFLKNKLEIGEQEKCKGTVLEVKEDKGLGTTLDVILYEGSLRVGDIIAVGTKQGVTETKIRTLLKPKPLSEIRDEKNVFKSVESVSAACGVKISAPNLENVLAGSPVLDASVESRQQILDEIKSIKISTEDIGLVIKADTLGSLEALIGLMKNNQIPVRSADVGMVTKKDVMEALASKEKDVYHGCIVAFNVEIDKTAEDEAKKREIQLFSGKVVYTIIDEYSNWVKTQKDQMKKNKSTFLISPAKIEVLRGFVFRRSDPAVVGVKVLIGKIKSKTTLINENTMVRLQGLQEEKKAVESAEKGKELAASLENAVIGRNLFEGDILYTYIPESQFEEIPKYLELNSEELALLEEIKNVQIKHKENGG